MQKDLQDFLQLYHSFIPARSSLCQLLERFDGNSRLILQHDAATLRAAGLDQKTINRIQAPSNRQVDADLEWAQRAGNHLLCYNDNHFPELLRQIPDYPVLLYASGNLDLNLLIGCGRAGLQRQALLCSVVGFFQSDLECG